MAQYTSNMNQEATYWPPGVSDGEGGVDFSAVEPVVLTCRWQDDATLFRDAQGRETVSQAVVYVDQEVEIGGYLAKGDVSASDPRDIPGCYEIRQRYRTTDLDGEFNLDKAIL